MSARAELAEARLLGYREGYYEGVQAAREAVAALIHSSLCDCESCFWMKPALAAIDGVRGEQSCPAK
jgi:hypothetical protein